MDSYDRSKLSKIAQSYIIKKQIIIIYVIAAETQEMKRTENKYRTVNLARFLNSKNRKKVLITDVNVTK